jgi:sortase A
MIVLIVFSVRVARGVVMERVTETARYLVMDAQTVTLPPLVVTPLPRKIAAGGGALAQLAPSPVVTPTPGPLPPTRIQIPAIDLDWPVRKSEPLPKKDWRGEVFWEWSVPDNAVGFHRNEALPGDEANLVFSGHNNWRGEVFRRLPDLKVGDEIILYTPLRSHYYEVTESFIVPYRRNPAEGERQLRAYASDFGDERITLVSCYPYYTNADRIVVIAKPRPFGATP